MPFRLTLILLPALLLIAAGCRDGLLPTGSSPGETTQAADYYPFTAEGFVIRWQANSTIRVDVIGSCAAQEPGTCLPGFENAVRDGINAWGPLHNRLGITVTFTANTDDEVTILWDDGFGSSGFNIPPGVIGFAAVALPPFVPSRFILMTTQCNTCVPPAPHTLQDIRVITAHEWGHMLGLWNHSFDPVDLLFPFKVGPEAISNRDAQTLLHAYTFAPNLDLSGMAPNPPFSAAGAPPGGFGGEHLLIRYVHQYGDPWRTTLDFNPPGR